MTAPPRPKRPMAHRRAAPRPLALHLAAAASIWTSSRNAWPLSSAGWRGWSPALAERAEALARELASADREAIAAALDREERRRLDAFLTGIENYRGHPHRRALADPPAVWREGTTRLLDYGGEGAGPPVFVVPSLVNKSYVLDLDDGVSMMRFLAGAGFRPFLVDWGAPDAAERAFSLTDYIAGRLVRALEAAVAATGARRLPLIGYCMGGNLTLALARLRPELASAIVFLATPWDFHVATDGPSPVIAICGRAIETTIAALGELPIDMLQGLFFALDPLQSWTKFRGFAGLDPASEAARRFAALEDWANDGVALAGPVARECLFGWYGDNTPAKGAWRVAGEAMRPEDLALPTLHVIPARDRIVPPESARALAQATTGAEMLSPAAGHVGMAVGSRARREVWEPVALWLRRL